MEQRPPGFWDIWWTLAVISAALGLTAVVLEYFGLLRDLGIVIGFASVTLTVLFGLTSSTRVSVRRIEFKLGSLERVLQDIRHILVERLPHP